MAKRMLEDQKVGSAEQSPATYPAGVYVFDKGPALPENERYSRIIAREHEKFGTVQADALVRVGYEFERPATAEELTEEDHFSSIIRPAEGAKSGGKSDAPTREEFDVLMAKLESLSSEKSSIDDVPVEIVGKKK